MVLTLLTRRHLDAGDTMGKHWSLKRLLRPRRERVLDTGAPPTPEEPAWSLENIPVEMVREIVGHLDRWVDKAALALVSKTLLYRLGKAAFQPDTPRKPDTPCKNHLLMRLERDGVYPEAIHCYSCHGFHSPFLSLPSACRHHGSTPVKSSDRLSQINTSDMANELMISPNLPENLHFNMVNAVMRCHRHNWKTYTPLMLATAEHWRDPDGPARMTIFTRCYVVRGRLILGQQRLILPASGTQDRAAAVSGLGGLLLHQWRRAAGNG